MEDFQEILVSVIIPTYNRIKTLPKAIDSVLQQTYQMIELIIVDDGSTDGTEEYVSSLDDNRVKYVRNERNLGPAAARNVGANIANGKYLAFQDSDDVWQEQKIEKQYNKIIENPECKMVYCEIGRWRDSIFLGELPSKTIPIEKKQGDIFEYLLLYPLISTQTILVDREAFLNVKFNEKLQSLEDYEFSIRFAYRYNISFVEETLVTVNDLPNSVNKRWSEKIRTQIYILETWVDELRKGGLLLDKIVLVRNEAENYGILNTFIEMMEEKNSIFSSEEKIQIATIVDQRDDDEKDNEVKINIHSQLINLEDGVKKLCNNICSNEELWTEEVDYALIDVLNSLLEYGKIFSIFSKNEEINSYIHAAKQKRDNRIDSLQLLRKTYMLCFDMRRIVESKLFYCNVCNNRVFFKPISPYYEIMRKRNGFLYWDATFQLENKENYECPICKSFDRDRLIIAFLDKLFPEQGEKLRLLQIAPSNSIEEYAKNRKDIIYESTDLYMNNVTFSSDIQDMYMVETEKYDVIVCSHVLEHVQDDGKAISELYRILKNDGCCIVLVPLIVGKNETEEKWGCSETDNWRLFGQGDHARLYGKRDFFRKFEEKNFIVNELSEEWFGEDYFKTYGFDKYSRLYVMTKDLALLGNESFEEEIIKKINQLQEEYSFLYSSLAKLNKQYSETI